jgi:hypothetical protein
LTGNKKIFDEPIIRAKINTIRFPKICPVCGKPATTTTWVSIRPHTKNGLRPQWDPNHFPSSRKRLGLKLTEMRSFQLHVCEDHQASDDGYWRMRGLTSLILTIVASVSIFVIMFAGSDLWAGRGLSPWVGSYILVLTASIFAGIIVFRPNALEDSFNIVGFDFDVQYVWLKLKDPQYRNKFISANEMNAELVNWVVKV